MCFSGEISILITLLSRVMLAMAISQYKTVNEEYLGHQTNKQIPRSNKT